MTFLDLRRAILETDLCASCGACAAVCPQDIIGLSADDPVPFLLHGVNEANMCGGCTSCLDVCPGLDPSVEKSESRIFGRERLAGERWTGITGRTYQARAVDARLRHAASAGGATTALLVAALEDRLIDAALVVGRDPERPWVPVPRLVSTVDDILDCAGASYCITPTLQLLRDAPYERVGVVGLACQVEALQKMRNLFEVPEVARKVALVIEIACASNTRRAGTEHLIEDRLRVPLVEVSTMRYRDGEYPGEFIVSDRQGERHSLPFHDLVLAFKKFKTNRCLVCPDWWSGLADISIADGDPNIFNRSQTGAAAEGTSLLITRTAVGDHLLDRALARGALDVRMDDFDPESSLGLQRKRHRYAHFAKLKPTAVPTPPVAADESLRIMTDDEVIDRMSL